MRTDIPPPPDYTLFDRSGAYATLYAATASPYDLVVETGGLPAIDLTPYVASMTHTHEQATIKLAYLNEFAGANRPAPGQCVSIGIGSQVAFNGVIDGISAARESRGQREVTLNIRRRDAFPAWRDVKRITYQYNPGIDINQIALDTAFAIGLSPIEVSIPPLSGIRLAHGSTQLADMSGWDIISTCLQTGMREPFVDARGVLKGISRDIRKPAVVSLVDTRIQQISEGVSRLPISRLRVRWLDPALTQSLQAERLLASKTVTIGFFSPNAEEQVFWSDDHLLRAVNTWMNVAKVIWPGIIPPIVHTSYAADSNGDFSGTINAASEAWIEAGLLGASYATSTILPDGVTVAAFGVGAGTTIPIGSVVQKALLLMFLQTLQTVSIECQIFGQPYDLVHAVNEVVAYDQNAPDWIDRIQDIENDLLPDDGAAQAVAVGELLYLSRATSRSQLVIADDLRLEPGDIVSIPDGRQFYITGYSRDLTRGAEALLQLDGFFT